MGLLAASPHSLLSLLWPPWPWLAAEVHALVRAAPRLLLGLPVVCPGTVPGIVLLSFNHIVVFTVLFPHMEHQIKPVFVEFWAIITTVLLTLGY